MAQLAPITIDDGLATPVARTFDVIDNQPRLRVWADKSAPKAHTVSGRPTISMSNRPTLDGNSNYKATLRIKIPMLEEHALEEGSSHKVTGVTTINLECIVPANMTEDYMDDAYAYLQNVLSNAQVIDLFKDQVLPW